MFEMFPFIFLLLHRHVLLTMKNHQIQTLKYSGLKFKDCIHFINNIVYFWFGCDYFIYNLSSNLKNIYLELKIVIPQMINI